MDRFWNDYLDRYANDSFYWFQPKGFTISVGNLDLIQHKLNLLQQFEGRPWRNAQAKYAALLQRSGLFKPRRTRRGAKDYAAIARMNKEVFDSLGLAWVSKDSIVQLTGAGRTYLGTRPARLPEFVAGQLRKYLYPNPAVWRADEEAGLFPYLSCLAVLAHFPKGIPSAAYELFLARMRTDEDRRWVVEHIARFSRLPSEQRRELRERLERLPILKGGRVQVGGRRTSLLNTIELNRSYMLALLRIPGLIQEQRDILRLAPDRHSEAESLVQDHLRNQCYIRFANAEDWIAFYGQLDRHPTHEEALTYYRARGDVERSTQVFRAGKGMRKLTAELRALDEGEFRKLQVLERTLEDFLEYNLELLEKGLSLVARQHPTATGPLDLLARDSSGRWVVIELKRDRAADKVLGQLLRYRAFILKERAGNRDERVRGFIVAPAPDRRLIEAARGASPVPVEVFEFTVKGLAKRLYPMERPRRIVARPRRTGAPKHLG